MRVMMVTPVFDTGGTEMYIINLMRYLRRKGIETMILTGEGNRITLLQKENFNYEIISQFSKKSIFNLLKSSFYMYKNIKNFKPDIIHTSSIFTTIISKTTVGIYNLLHADNIKIVNTLHGGPNKDIERESSKILQLCADKVIALSYNSKEILTKHGLKENKIEVIYNGIELYEREKKDKIDDDILLVSCGRLTEQKGYLYLIKAIKEVSKKYKNIKLQIFGDGELRQVLEDEIRRLDLVNIIELMGYKSDIYKYVNNADIFILPSLWEQFPISILEAMYYAKPIIASEVNGIREQIDDSGILIKPGNIEELSTAISILVEDKNKRCILGQLAKDRFESNFTLENMGEKTINCYNNI